jgi:hypothetical protein
MKGRSKERTSSRGIHCRSESSSEAREKSSGSPARRAASARKKRASNRRVRPGGVIARKTKDRASAEGRWPVAAKVLQSAGGSGQGGGAAEEEPRLLPEFADGGGGERPGARAGGAVLEPGCAGGREGRGEGDRGVGGVHRAAGEDEFRRHEGGGRAALAHQDARARPRVADEDDGGGVADGVGHARAQAGSPKPCIRLAHWKPTMAPFSRGRR